MAIEDSNTAFLMAALRKHGGEDAVRAVQGAFGGTKLKVPTRKVRGKSRFEKVVGLELALKVVAEIAVRDAEGRIIGNFMADIPLGARKRSVRLAKQIDALREAGTPVQDIAVKLSCSERTVWRRLSNLKRAAAANATSTAIGALA